MKHSPLAVVTAIAILLSACGGSGSDDGASPPTTDPPEPVSTSTTMAAAGSTPAPPAPPVSTTSSAPNADGGRADDLGSICTGAQVPSGGQYEVVAIPPDDRDGGLVARQLPDPTADAIDVLAPGTIVDTFVEADACAGVESGAVWWEIGSPELATGGWVNSSYLAPLGDPDDQDGFDLARTQKACIYDGDGAACDLLTTFGYTEDTNHGVGNSYAQAPDTALAEDCDAGDVLACAEQTERADG